MSECECESLEEASKNTFCFRGTSNCKYYQPLKGEGETQTIKKTRLRQKCIFCSAPATWRITFLVPNARHDCASSGYGKDDISWCSDEESFSCNEHKAEVERYYDKPTSWRTPRYEWCASFPLKNFPHMGLYWKEEKIIEDVKL